MTSTLIPAASLMLIDDIATGYEVLMVQRSASLVFAGGADVFPGGRIDADDWLVAADPELTGAHGLEPIDAASRVGAIRETLEEVGVLVGNAEVDDQIESMRQQLSENKSFSQILRDHGLRLNLALLVPFAWWHPPHGIARRFDTRFYVAAARDQQRDTARPDGGEAVAAFWASPADVLAAAERGERQIIFPTRCNLERMAAFPTFAALIAHARAQALVKVEAWVEERADGKWLCIPDNAGYPVTAMRLTAIRRG